MLLARAFTHVPVYTEGPCLIDGASLENRVVVRALGDFSKMAVSIASHAHWSELRAHFQ